MSEESGYNPLSITWANSTGGGGKGGKDGINHISLKERGRTSQNDIKIDLSQP